MVLECIPRAGIPLPTVTWSRQPTGAIVSTRGNGTILRVDSVTESFCVDCLGNSVAGSDTETVCVDVLRKLSHSDSHTPYEVFLNKFLWPMC